MADNPFEVIATALTPHGINAVGVNAQGQYVDANGQPTTLLKQPNMVERALSPYAQQISTLNDQYNAAGLEAQQNRQLQRNQTLQDVATQPWQNNPYAGAFGQPQTPPPTTTPLSTLDTPDTSMYSGLIKPQAANYHTFTSGAPTISNIANTNLADRENQAWVTQQLHPSFSPTLMAQETGSQARIGTGLIVPTAVNEAQAGYATSDYGRRIAQAQQQAAPTDAVSILAEANNRLAQDVGVTPLELQHQRNVLGAQVGQDQVEAQINKSLNQAKLSQAQTAAKVAPMQQKTDTANAISDWWRATNPADLVRDPFRGSVNPDMGSIMLGRYFPNPDMKAGALMLGGGGLGGMSGGKPVTLPSGKTIIAAPTNQPIVSPLGVSPTLDGGATDAPASVSPTNAPPPVASLVQPASSMISPITSDPLAPSNVFGQQQSLGGRYTPTTQQTQQNLKDVQTANALQQQADMIHSQLISRSIPTGGRGIRQMTQQEYTQLYQQYVAIQNQLKQLGR